MDKKFITEEQEDFCRTCSAWVLLHVTLMGIKCYGCKAGLKPRETKRGVACRYRKRLEVK